MSSHFPVGLGYEKTNHMPRPHIQAACRFHPIQQSRTWKLLDSMFWWFLKAIPYKYLLGSPCKTSKSHEWNGRVHQHFTSLCAIRGSIVGLFIRSLACPNVVLSFPSPHRLNWKFRQWAMNGLSAQNFRITFSTYIKWSNNSLIQRLLMVKAYSCLLLPQGLWLKAHGSWPRQIWRWVPQAP